VLVEVTQNSAFAEKAYNNASVGQVAMIWPKPLLGLAQPSVKAALVLSLGYVYSADNPYLFIQLFVVRTFFQYPYSGVGILVVTLTLILILILLTLTVTLK